MKDTTCLLIAAAISISAPAIAATDSGLRPIPATAFDNDTVGLQTLRGTVTMVDEPNDKVTLRLSPNETADLKVDDGLLFNALRYGDAVRVTVRTIGGAKTIVDLIKE
jgi:hypothetical protein